MLKSATPVLAHLNAGETIAFYTDVLGFRFHSEWDGYLIFSRDDISIHLWPTNDPEVPKNTGCYIYVTEVDELYNELSAKNIIHPEGHIKDMPWNMRQFSILDNNGNLIHFGEDIASRLL